MKQLYILLILFVYNLSAAQDARIYENTWYLTKIHENGVDYFPLNNFEAASIPLVFDEQGGTMQTDMCNALWATVGFENNMTGFSLSNMQATLGWCSYPPNDNFDNRYMGFYLGNFEPNSFTYSITDVNDQRALTVTSLSGYQAIYSDVLLSVNKSSIQDVSFYPNPASDYINVKLDNANLDTAQIEIYNSLGKLCVTEKIKSGEERISIADLAAGVYMITVSNDAGSMVRKFVKL